MTDEQVAEVAIRMSGSQQQALRLERGSAGVCRRLREKGLATTVIGTGMAWDARVILSPLGLAVKDHLERTGHAD